MDLNLAFLAARPIFKLGIRFWRSYFRELPSPDRDRPSVARMLRTLDGLDSALGQGKIDGIVAALAEVELAKSALRADELPGGMRRIVFRVEEEDDDTAE